MTHQIRLRILDTFIVMREGVVVFVIVVVVGLDVAVDTLELIEVTVVVAFVCEVVVVIFIACDVVVVDGEAEVIDVINGLAETVVLEVVVDFAVAVVGKLGPMGAFAV